MRILQETSLTVSEVAYEVGFSSPSYFIKCFHDYYGYPPGETTSLATPENNSSDYQDPGEQLLSTTNLLKRYKLISFVTAIILLLLSLILIYTVSPPNVNAEKSIAVLPFIVITSYSIHYTKLYE